MSKRKYTEISLKEKKRIIELMSEHINSKTGNLDYFKLSQSIEYGGIGHSRQKLKKWWKKKNRDQIRWTANKYKRKRIKSAYSSYHSKMEIKLND
jgi:hypothetical protein